MIQRRTGKPTSTINSTVRVPPNAMGWWGSKKGDRITQEAFLRRRQEALSDGLGVAGAKGDTCLDTNGFASKTKIPFQKPGAIPATRKSRA